MKVFESGSAVGGLSRTIVRGGFRFDLGGHRFFTVDPDTNQFVKDLMEDELVSVPRKSKIFMRNRYFDYPLKPLNAFLGLGLASTSRIVSAYGLEKIKRMVRKKDLVSLEDWVVGNFGREMFNIYFREYSEKVWGIRCDEISADWVSQRISGLSLLKAVKNAFFSFSGRDLPTLADRFLYPALGIGRISERLKEEIEKSNEVYTDTRVQRICHSHFRIENVHIAGRGGSDVVSGEEFISSLPLTSLVRMLHPSPPGDILKAAAKLRFRDLVVVAVMVGRKRITGQTWIYVPEREIPFGRIHEPTNWSEKMAPEGKTILVMEFFSFRGDDIWNAPDGKLIDIAIHNLEKLGFTGRHEMIGSTVLRVPDAYPLFDVGYREPCDKIYSYLENFKNLHIAGRGGMFRYYNMDHAIRSGIDTAGRIIGNMRDARCRIQVEEEQPLEACIMDRASLTV